MFTSVANLQCSKYDDVTDITIFITDWLSSGLPNLRHWCYEFNTSSMIRKMNTKFWYNFIKMTFWLFLFDKLYSYRNKSNSLSPNSNSLDKIQNPNIQVCKKCLKYSAGQINALYYYYYYLKYFFMYINLRLPCIMKNKNKDVHIG